MLTQSSLPSSIEAALSFVYDHGKQDLPCDWISSGESWQKCSKCVEKSLHEDYISAEVANEVCASPHSLIQSRACLNSSSASTMCASSAPNLVYKRRKLQNKSPASVLPVCATYSRKSKKVRKESGGCLPENCSEMTSVPTNLEDNIHSQNKNEGYSVRAPVMDEDVCKERSSIPAQLPHKVYKKRKIHPQKLGDVSCTRDKDSRSLEFESNNGCSDGGEQKLDDASKNNTKRLESESNPGCSFGEERKPDEDLNNTIQMSALDYSSLNDSCSTSKSNVGHGSASKTDIDDAGECSSSDQLTRDLGGSPSEKEVCVPDVLRNVASVPILEGHELREKASMVKNCCSIDDLDVSVDKCHFRSCKTCGDLESPLKMLICDNCEEAFHVSCCNPRVRKIAVDEWYCQTCSRKRKLSMDNTSLNSKGAASKCRSRTKGESDPISFMMKDTEPYTTGVRIGKAFQAQVPEWSGPISIDVDCIGEPLEMDPTESDRLYGLTSNKSSTPSSIGNWLQCREILDIDTGDDTICGKWRRAPLFEVQTDDWDCSCAVLWDPVHSDCAVPQELETDKVLTHLKYIEMLRPRLCAKKKEN